MSSPERDAIRDRLHVLALDGGGRLTPDAVVADAADPNSPLHDAFEWDDSKAAQAYRIEQARVLIRSVEVTIRTDVTILRAPFYVRDPQAGDNEQGYVPVASLRTQKDLAREVAVAEFSRAAHYLRRARAVARALDVEGDIDRLLDGIMGLRERVAESVVM